MAGDIQCAFCLMHNATAYNGTVSTSGDEAFIILLLRGREMLGWPDAWRDDSNCHFFSHIQSLIDSQIGIHDEEKRFRGKFLTREHKVSLKVECPSQIL